jgi:hypothetical protein
VSGRFDALFNLAGCRMTIEVLRHRLECLGWRPLDERHDDEHHYAVLAESCDEFILAFGSTQERAWEATCEMAMKITGGRSGE